MQVEPIFIPPEWDTKHKCLHQLHTMMFKLGAGREKEESFSSNYNAAYYLKMNFIKDVQVGRPTISLDAARRGLRRLFLHYARAYAEKSHIYQVERLRTPERRREIIAVVHSTIGTIWCMTLQNTTIVSSSDGTISLGCDEARLFDQDPKSVPEVNRFVADFVTESADVSPVDLTTRWGLKLHITKIFYQHLCGRCSQEDVGRATEALMLEYADFRAVIESVDPLNNPGAPTRMRIEALMAKRNVTYESAAKLLWNLDRWRGLALLIGRVGVVRRRCLPGWNEYQLRPENLENVASYTDARTRFESMSA